MNILLVSSNLGSESGGEMYLVNLARGMQRRGFEISLLVSDDPAMDNMVSRMPGSVLIMRQPMKPTFERNTRCLGAVRDSTYIAEIADLFRDVLPDVVHVNQLVAEDGLDLLAAAQQSGIPYVSTVHVAQDPSQLNGRFGRIRRMVTRRALNRGKGPIIAVSDALSNTLRQWVPPSVANRVVTVHNGVPVPTPTMGARVRTRERLHIANDDPVIGVVGNLQAQKGPLFLLDVMQLMDQNGCCPDLVWIGDGELRDRFDERVKELKLEHRVNVTGWVERSADYLAALDCFCLPSQLDGLPLSLLEAMRMGLCCVANKVGGISEAVENDSSGVLVRQGDVNAWADTLERVLGDRPLRTRLGEGALGVARSRFSLARMAEATAVVYESVLLDDALESTT